ncbi:cadmium resistance transporter [Microbacterium sp. NPDC006705]|uniref:Cadmium resistance transporter n=1 Tax=Microbacterium thalli TaxID=3027921 RepID=A0ABT5SLS1_9MICO|nr:MULTISPECIES: cadmium resistance transporter [Microbacterium]MCZ4069126.1 cadmium resistance transporter [Microbacterium sp. H37-C3]MDD7963621.1 cadmium resistance transporter [Microbacterium thalli]MDN8550051.1 cadmium resistance transporter [Microbacterium thalli]WHE36218.1 cadmium resistance transporter [Microbacterium sp. BDGP8]WRK17222.1 cadmium resistance transporter [Microbacterium plantarum]
MIGTIAAAIGLFAATNIDDIVVLTVLFLASTRGSLPGWKVVAGQYLGFIALVAISVIAAAGLTIVPDEWVGFLGLIPLAIGVYGLIRTLRRRGDDDDDSAISAGGLFGVAGITIANGADNISLYTPVFRTNPVPDTIVTIIVFLVLVAVWCLVARFVGTNKTVTEALEKIEHWLVPAVFIGLGLYILIESGVVLRLIDVLS